VRLGICCHASLGGSAVIAVELGLALARRGHEVHFICAHAPPRLVHAPNVTLHEVRSPTHPLFPHGDFTLALASRLAHVSRTQRLELLHVHYAVPLATSALLARELLGAEAPKLVVTVHGTDVLSLGLEPTFAPLVRHALQRCDVVTAPSQFLARAAQAVADRPVEVVSNFVDLEHFQPGADLRARLGFSKPTPKIITHASNFRSLKRVQDVVAIFTLVRAHTPCNLVLMGDGPERPAIEALVRERGLEDEVRFFGEQPDVAWLLQSSDVFVMPSEVESFGLAAAEASSCGVPVVASDTGGLPEVVADGRTGFLHPVGDVAAMARSTIRLLKELDLHHAMSAAARQWASRWQPGPIVSAWESLYARVLG
jgi:L-malate glycosyltransferase